jgi:hypothetical protein
MGFRTVVMLNNDMCHEWSKDPNLGSMIQEAMNYAHTSHPDRKEWSRLRNYGRVVECVHADTQTLVRLDHYQGFEPLAYTGCTYGPSTEEDKLKLLKRAAEEMGYRLVKKSK